MDSEKRWVVEKVKRLTPQAELYKEKIESWIGLQDDNSISQLLALFGNTEFVRECVPYFEAFHFAYIVVQITKGEMKNALNPCFVRNGHCLSELEQLIRRLRFVLWRMEFLDAGVAGNELEELCTEYAISPEALHLVICMNAMFPKKSYLAVIGVFLENGRVDAAKGMLTYALESYPGDRDFEGLRKLL